MNTYKIYIDNKEYTNATIPFSYGEFLDKELDHATIELTRIPKEHFNPTTPVRIEITSKSVGKDGTEYVQEKTLDYIISSDRFQEMPVGSGYFRHNLTLIEPTKLLEGIPVETLCFTNAGIDEYYVIPFSITTTLQEVNGVFFNNKNVIKKIKKLFYDKKITYPVPTDKIFNFPSANELMQALYDGFSASKPQFTSCEYKIFETGTNKEIKKVEGLDDQVIYTPNKDNDIFINLTCYNDFFPVGLNIYIEPFSTIEFYGTHPLVPWTIKSVIERVLDLEKPILYVNQSVFKPLKERRFKLEENPNIDFNALSPEFTFTRMSLREVLQMIGSYIHAEPRLKRGETGEFDTIAFDSLDTQEKATYFNTYEKIYKDLSTYPYENFQGIHSIEQACTALDSYMQNLVSHLNGENSAIGQPYDGGYQSLRMENSSLRFEDNDSVFFPTAYPIQQIHKFTVFVDGEAIDITPTIYDERTYNTQLSTYANTIGNSKSYALYYTQGGKGIRGFFFLNERITGNIFNKYAISKIIQSYTNYVSNPETMQDVLNLGFELIYTPIYSARISHSKSYIGDWLNYPRILNYSQGANSVEMEYFGENIKGAVERLGTLEKTYTFTCYNLDTIPKPGQMWDNEYCISTVSVEVGSEKFKVTCGLSKHFNRISEYISLPSYKRLYEVSEVMTQERETIYKDYLVITQDDKMLNYNSSKDCFANHRITMNCIMRTFSQKNDFLNCAKISSVNAQLFTKKLDPLTIVTLPVIASASGNVMEFTWQYKDNFSAGQKVVKANVGGKDNNYGQDVQYSDYYGRGYFEQFALVGNEPAQESIESFAKLPAYTGTGTYGVVGVPASHYLLTRKDSREALKRTYAMEFVTDESSFVIGSAIASYCPLVVGFKEPVKLYLLRNRINKFSKKVDLSESNVICSFDMPAISKANDSNGLQYLSCKGVDLFEKDFASNYPGERPRAWAYVTSKRNGEKTIYSDEDGIEITMENTLGGELLFGKNGGFTFNGVVGNFHIIPTHDVYDYLKEKNN